jgi:hypothetical protein
VEFKGRKYKGKQSRVKKKLGMYAFSIQNRENITRISLLIRCKGVIRRKRVMSIGVIFMII